MLDILRAHDVEMLILAGFMAILSREFVQNYPDRILNVHPSLIPRSAARAFTACTSTRRRLPTA